MYYTSATVNVLTTRVCSLVRLVDILYGEDGQVAVVSEIAQRNARAGLEASFVDDRLRHVESDGHREEKAAGEAVLLYDSVAVLVSEKRSFGKHKVSHTHCSRPRS